ncbi:type III pantothenate kinase [Anaerorhabdus sp.]|nr:type III pantothenate kinase [Anaerorhabdus sp.]MEA4875525.1 type III pantothenate kinase [Anaerorhabdus sp.]
MLLTIDVGNTNITMGVFDGDNLIGNFRLTTKTPRTSDEFGICLQTLLTKYNIEPEQINDVIISSVVPKVMHALNNCSIKYLNKTPIIIGPGIKTGIQIQSDNPKEVGADRIVNVAAAYYTYHQACLIIDFGTATTFDYVSDKGVFEYTVIAPGIEISAQALWNQTAKLPEIEIKKPEKVLAKNTVNGMQSGIVNGYIGQVEYLIKAILKELNTKNVKVIATGGLGRIIYNETDCIDVYDPDLAFKGMKIIYDRNN